MLNRFRNKVFNSPAPLTKIALYKIKKAGIDVSNGVNLYNAAYKIGSSFYYKTKTYQKIKNSLKKLVK